jgi:hypothetical protein
MEGAKAAGKKQIYKAEGAGYNAIGLGAKWNLGSRQILNPGSATLFKGNGIRSFTFEFSFSADTAQDSNQFRHLHNLFRAAIYAKETAENTKVILDYPPVWTITVNNPNGTRNEWYPQTHQCFLTGVTTNFNSSGQMHHIDYSPTQINLSLSFTETRVLTRTDIEKRLNARGYTESEQKALDANKLEVPKNDWIPAEKPKA